MAVMRDSYNLHSDPQERAIESSLRWIEQSLGHLQLDEDEDDGRSALLVADFGSSHGKNSIFAMKHLLHALKAKGVVKEGRAVLVVHNDLPGNKWSTLFQLLNEEKAYVGVAQGRSFYEPCLPAQSLTIGYSSTSLHWLTRKPCNISTHCSSLFARDEELEAFRRQSRVDWEAFLRHRSAELVAGGLLLLLVPAVDAEGSNGFDLLRELLYACGQSVLSAEECLDYTLPIHARSVDECVDRRLFASHSLQLVHWEFQSVKLPFDERCRVEEVTAYVRSWSESLLEDTLRRHRRTGEEVEATLRRFWALYNERLAEQTDRLLHSRMNYINLLLKKKRKTTDGDGDGDEE